MATYNIEMNQYNGSSYDQLYPKTSYSNLTGTKPSYSFSEISGTLGTSQYSTIPINKGGTNGTSANQAMYNLINGMSTLTSAADGDYIPIQDVSAGSSGGRKITVANLLGNISSGGTNLFVESFIYTGTGSSTLNIVLEDRLSFCEIYLLMINPASPRENGMIWNNVNYGQKSIPLVFSGNNGSYYDAGLTYNIGSNNYTLQLNNATYINQNFVKYTGLIIKELAI